jgi:hypothetical protein
MLIQRRYFPCYQLALLTISEYLTSAIYILAETSQCFLYLYAVLFRSMSMH